MAGKRLCIRVGIRIRDVNHFRASNRVSCTLALHAALQNTKSASAYPFARIFGFKHGAVFQSEFRISRPLFAGSAENRDYLCDKIWTRIRRNRSFSRRSCLLRLIARQDASGRSRDCEMTLSRIISQYLVLNVWVTLGRNLHFKYTITFCGMKLPLDVSEFRVLRAF